MRLFCFTWSLLIDWHSSVAVFLFWRPWCLCVWPTGAPLHDGSYLTPADLAGLRQSASSPDSSPMAAMLRDAAASGAGHFGAPPPPQSGQPPPHGLPGAAAALHGPPFSRYSSLRHPGPQQTQLPPNSQSGPPQSAVEVPAEIWWWRHFRETSGRRRFSPRNDHKTQGGRWARFSCLYVPALYTRWAMKTWPCVFDCNSANRFLSFTLYHFRREYMLH